MRRWHNEASVKGLAAAEPFTGLIEGVLGLAQEGLINRGRGEEVYLEPLWARLQARENPAQNIRRIFAQRGGEGLVDNLRIRI